MIKFSKIQVQSLQNSDPLLIFVKIGTKIGSDFLARLYTIYESFNLTTVLVSILNNLCLFESWKWIDSVLQI